MPLFALIARDRKNGLERRMAHRPAHLEHMARLDASGRIRYGGPLLNEKNEMSGSLIIIEADDLEAARSFGLKTAFIARPTEYGPDQKTDLKAEDDWDVIADSIEGVADALGV